jgi:hypothetical protein
MASSVQYFFLDDICISHSYVWSPYYGLLVRDPDCVVMLSYDLLPGGQPPRNPPWLASLGPSYDSDICLSRSSFA